MLGTLISYFVIFSIIARLVSITAKINWMPTLKTTPKHDAMLAIIFSLIVVALTFIG